MTAFTRTISFSAYQYSPATPADENEVFTQWKNVGRELAGLSVYDVHILDSNILLVVQRHHDADGDRSNIQHKLRPSDWLVEDHTAEGGYRVMTGEEFRGLPGLASTEPDADRVAGSVG